MLVCVTEAKSRLTELVRRAEAGEEIILTRYGHAVVKLVAVTSISSSESRKLVIQKSRELAKATTRVGLSVARSQDDLYTDDGMP